ncbi:MAG: pyrroloquinoline quinone-dependent dehydrogenase [Bryobacterales bacterium]|nr:pyrroloquinoline quinone-dependent dehydrogenase [Bryobacterales bacterium]
MPYRPTRRAFMQCAALSTAALHTQPASPYVAATDDWRHYGGSLGATRYSELDQINRSNVSDLKVAWVHATGDSQDRPATKIECTPIVVDGRMYVTTAQVQVRALDATTGEMLWNFDPFEGIRMRRSKGVNRGVAYWSDGSDRRIFMSGSAQDYLYCLNADTGKLVPEFADGGVLDMKLDLDRDMPDSVRSYYASPPVIFEDMLLLGGGSGSEGPAPAAPGHIRAFDVRTGKRLWIFHTIPHPGEFGYETWGKDSWKTAGGANNWGGMSLDPERGWLFVSTGSPTYDFYGADRPGANLFGNCVIALDARTGERQWHYQTIHHDLWDYDLPAQPVLARRKNGNQWQDLVVQISKQAFWYIFDRGTGEPIWEIEEVPVPDSDMEGEHVYPTQPFPTKPPPFARQGFESDEYITDISEESREYIKRRLKDLRRGMLYTPPSRGGTVYNPGTVGGTIWGGTSHDPEAGLMFINTNNWPKFFTLIDAPEGLGYPLMHTGYPFFVDQDKYSAAKPPWGELLCLDLVTGDYRWRRPIGEYAELKAKGIEGTGTFNVGGSIVTKGGLLFLGATQDEKFWAFDTSTGKALFEHQLSAGGYATPCTYAVDGKQYVVIAAGGGGRDIGSGGRKSGDEFVAFSLE